jgi:hypothetical protein
MAAPKALMLVNGISADLPVGLVRAGLESAHWPEHDRLNREGRGPFLGSLS